MKSSLKSSGIGICHSNEGLIKTSRLDAKPHKSPQEDPKSEATSALPAQNHPWIWSDGWGVVMIPFSLINT